MAHQKMSLQSAVEHVNRLGACLVFPQDNRAEPMSLWRAFFPRSQMHWDWDSGADPRVAQLWFLREELSRSGQLVYCKWYKGRATLFSKEVFVALLAAFQTAKLETQIKNSTSRKLYAALEDNSPLSTKEIKRECDLVGKMFEGDFQKGMKDLWNRCLIVAAGERDDGAFPSLLVGATKLLFEDLWRQSQSLSQEKAWALLESRLGIENPFYREARKQAKNSNLL